MKYLVMGCNGMAGHMVALYLKEQGHDVTGFARKDIGLVPTVVGDATDFDLVRRIITEGNYDYVVNCIGILNRDAENHRADAVLINSFLPHFLADITKDSKTKIIHLSTDCVFSGKRGQYTENDLRDGESFYDRSKALGELEDNKNLTIRTSIIGPDLNEDGIGLLNWFMKQNGTIKGYTRAIWTGITTLELAKIIDKTNGFKLTGLHNVVPESSISKYELLKIVNNTLKDNHLSIEKDDEIVLDKSLVPSAIIKTLLRIPGYNEMIEELAKWIKKRKQLYPNYF